MYNITHKASLNDSTVLMRVYAPKIAAKAKPGQFIIFRIDELSERIPLTIAEADKATGEITIIFQTVGATTSRLGMLAAGDSILDFTGPLGRASELEGYKKAAVVGGGLGCAIAYPQAKYLHELGCEVDIIAGFRSTDLIILEEEMTAFSNRLIIMTDDGSNGHKGLVTDALRERIEAGAGYDIVIAIGPPIMMKFVCKLTAEYGIKTVVSMNPIMIDGTGMCGGCRISVGGKTRFACIDGPDFDGHAVNFDELIMRNKTYREREAHACKLLSEEVNNA
jgi:ferredoxin/flavodoxin---NADP+ reductase